MARPKGAITMPRIQAIQDPTRDNPVNLSRRLGFREAIRERRAGVPAGLCIQVLIEDRQQVPLTRREAVPPCGEVY